MKKLSVLILGFILFIILTSCNLSNLFKKEECTIICDASVSPTSGVAPLSVVFMANATVTGCKETPTYTWDFGDQGMSTTQNTSHVYSEPGTYVWNLTVTAGGVQCTKSGVIKVTGRKVEPPSSEDYKQERPSREEGTAGIGVKLVTNLRTGVFRVKINNELMAEHSFHNEGVSKNILRPKKLLKAKEYEWAKEFKVPAGDCKIKFVIEDNQGSRGEKVININLKPNQHKFFRVVVKGAPGDIRVEM